MTNAELIKALKDAELYIDYVAPRCYASMEAGKAIRAAADALEAAEKRIARLEEDLKTREAEREVMQDTIKVCENRIEELEKSYSWKAYAALEESIEGYKTRIAELEDDLRNSTISNPERFKIYGYTVKDLLLFADMCKRNDVREADLKQAAWNLELAVRAVMNERQEIIENAMGAITMRFTPDFEKAFEEMMKGEEK